MEIRSPDPRVPPALRFDYLSSEQDRREWLEAVRSARSILGQPAFRELDARSFLPQVEGAILATIGWMGFQEDGRPVVSLSREEVQARAEDLALAMVARRD